MPQQSRISAAADRTPPGSVTLLRGVRLTGASPSVDVRLADGVVAAIGVLEPAPGEEVIGHDGALLLPGMVDSHVHTVAWASRRQRVEVGPATSPADVIDLLHGGPEAGFLIGHGFRDGLWAVDPHKDQLERAFPGRPVAVVSHDLHCVWLSPAALSVMGLDHPTGVLREQASLQAQAWLTEQVSVVEKDRWVREALASAAARGITEIVDFEYADTVLDWQRRAGHARLGVRVQGATWTPWLDDALDARRRTGDLVADTAGLVRVGPFKVIVDGSLNSRTAYCYDAYSDPADAAESHGLLLVEPEELLEVMARAVGGGLIPAVHAIGDRANAMVLDAFEQLDTPGRIEHAQLVRDEDVPRFARAGLVASIQPQHAVADRDVADRHWSGMSGHAFPYGRLAAAGARLVLGSDAPVADPDPWAAIADAVARTDDDRPPWLPAECLTLPTALTAACAGRATVRVGDRADVVVVGEDPATLSIADLRRMPVLQTFVGGVSTFRAE